LYKVDSERERANERERQERGRERESNRERERERDRREGAVMGRGSAFYKVAFFSCNLPISAQ